MNKYRRPTSGELTLITEKLAVYRRHEKLALFLECLLIPGFGLLLSGVVIRLPICCVFGLILVYAAAWAMTNNVNVGAGRVLLDEIRVMDGKAARESTDEYLMDPQGLDGFMEFVSSDGDVFSQLFPADSKITDDMPMLLICAPTNKGSYNENLMFVVPSPALSHNE